MKETIKQLNEQMDYITRIFEDGKIGSVIYNSYYLVHQIATDALRELTEKDATIKRLEERLLITLGSHKYCEDEIIRLRKALEEARGQIEIGGTHPEVLRRMIKIIDAALGEGNKNE